MGEESKGRSRKLGGGEKQGEGMLGRHSSLLAYICFLLLYSPPAIADTVTQEDDTLHHILVLQPEEDFSRKGQRCLKQPHVGTGTMGHLGRHVHRDSSGSLPLKPVPLSRLCLPFNGKEKPRFQNVKRLRGYFVVWFFLA